ncbi:hypothetical protein NP493_303g01008 [Ridgeia piscesae]|uniref:Galaxin-like repeats domain-containing protein n=1 Tax=Ridgeia piscesae TaxID=27915 RepID=A0AAD9NW62_RIDPI|nr:hypothetical protein NP493_303g01008 [Ridgeia piscesae]
MWKLKVLILILVVYGSSDAFFFDRATTSPLKNVHGAHECDGKTYDDDLYVCCNYELYEKNPHSKCCYGEMIDTRLHFCVFGKFAKPSSNCNGNYYDEESQFCCAGKIHDIDDDWKCCSGVLYNTNMHTCTFYGNVVLKNS